MRKGRGAIIFLAFTVLIAMYFPLPQPSQSAFQSLMVQDVSWPSFETCKRSLAEIMNGYNCGYVRTAAGYLIFSFLALSFLGLGRIFMTQGLDRIFRRLKTRAEMSLLERGVLCYMLGSSCWALLWLLLGRTSSAKESLAFLMLFAGILIFGVQVKSFWAGLKKVWREEIVPAKSPAKDQALLIVMVIAVLLLISLFSVMPPNISDEVLSTGAISNYYKVHGAVKFEPYHLYTYMPQNMEMLGLWALLLHSETAANLLVWGFSFAWIVFMLGYWARKSSWRASLLYSLLALSAPAFFRMALSFRNDVPSAFLVFVHYVALAEALDKTFSNGRESTGWLILSGLSIGCAVAFKLGAVPYAGTTFLFMGFLWAFHLRAKGVGVYFPVAWSLAALLPALPWFMRSFLETGNPLYPFFHSLFGRHLYPWHFVGYLQPDSSVTLRELPAMEFMHRTFSYVDEYAWGPTLGLFILPLFIRKSLSRGARLAYGLAGLSCILMLWIIRDFRYFIGCAQFLLSVAVVSCYQKALDEKPVPRLARAFVLCIPWLAWVNLVYVYHAQSIWKMARSVAGVAVSGLSPGNFKLRQGRMDQWYWMCHLVNTRTAPSARVLFLESVSNYGLDRKFRFNGGHPNGRPLLGDIAETSATPDEIHKALAASGFEHLICFSLFEQFYANLPPEFALKKESLIKLRQMINQHMTLRAKSPDGSLSWYSFNQAALYSPILYTPDDARKYPMMMIEEAITRCLRGEKKQAEEILKLVLSQPLHETNKELASFMSRYIEAPNYGSAIQLARYYLSQRKAGRASEFFEEALKWNPVAIEPKEALQKIYSLFGRPYK